MADNVLQVGVQVDTAPLDSGMQTATSVVQEAAAEMESSMTTATSEMAAGFHEVEAAATESMERTSEEVEHARTTLALFKEVVGVTIPRHLRGLVAESQLFGAAASAAFAPFVALAFFEVINKITEKISELISDAFIFTEEMKEGLKEDTAASKELQAILEHTAQLEEQHYRNTHTALEVANRDLESQKLTHEQIVDKLKEAQAEQAKLIPLWREAKPEITSVGDAIFEDDSNVKALNKSLDEVGRTIQKLRAKLTESGAGTDVAQDAQTKAATAAADEYARRVQQGYAEMQPELRRIIQLHYEELQAWLHKGDAATAARHDQEVSDELATKGMEALAKMAHKAEEEKVRAARLAIDEEMKLDDAAYQGQVQNIDAEFKLHQINAQQRLKLLTKALDDEHRLRVEALQRRLELDKQDPDHPENVQRDHAELLLEWQKYLNARNKLIDGATELAQQHFESYFNNITRAFDTSLQGMIMGTQTWQKALSDIWKSILGEFINFLIQKTAKWIENEIEEVIFGKTTALQKLAAAAGVAYGEEYAAWAPFDAIAPGIAETMASVAAGNIMTVGGSIASAAGGMEVDRDQLAYVHRNEMVLPADISGGLKGMIGQGGGGGDSHVEVHFHVNAVDGQSVAQFFRSNADTLAREVSRAVRHGKMRFNS